MAYISGISSMLNCDFSDKAVSKQIRMRFHDYKHEVTLKFKTSNQ